MEWLVNPLLGAILLVLTAMIAKNVFDVPCATHAVVIAVLSPYFLGNVIGWISHPLCAVLIAGAFFCCFRWMDTERIQFVIGMLLLLALTFHVRPFTAFLAAAVLAPISLISAWRRQGTAIRLAGAWMITGVVVVATVLIYNWAYTGRALTSPYALYLGTSTPPELAFSFQTLVVNAISYTRWGAQGTFLTTTPFLFLLAAYGMWRSSTHSLKVLALGSIFPLLCLGYAFNPMPSASRIGERFWFEGFFAVTILGGYGILSLIRRFRARRSTLRSTLAAVLVVQACIGVRVFGALVQEMDGYSVIRETAQGFEECGCAVFLDLGPQYYGEHLNLNSAEWQDANVFYLVDPGSEHRETWARRFGFSKWNVISYDAEGRDVRVTKAFAE